MTYNYGLLMLLYLDKKSLARLFDKGGFSHEAVRSQPPFPAAGNAFY
jgi:hypothetical protein